MERNSEDIWREKEMRKLIEDFKKSGYEEKELLVIKDKVIEHMANHNEQNKTDTITFPVYFFEELKDFRKILKDSETDIQTLIGNTRIALAMVANPPTFGGRLTHLASFSRKFPQREMSPAFSRILAQSHIPKMLH